MCPENKLRGGNCRYSRYREKFSPIYIRQAFYRVTGSSTLVTFTGVETQGGLVNGTKYGVHIGRRSGALHSLQLFRSGSLLRQGTDYTLSANMTTFSTASIPKMGDSLVASCELPPLVALLPQVFAEIGLHLRLNIRIV